VTIASSTTSTVSVALCTRNGAAYLREQVESILRQTVVPFEVVLSDDDSSDGSIELVEQVFSDFQRSRPGAQVRLVVLRNVPPLGVTGNFERAIMETTGEFVVLCDQDDVWNPERIELAVARFAAVPELLLLHGDARLVDKAGAPLGLSLFEALEVSAQERADIHGGRAFHALVRRNLVTGATTMFRRALLTAAAPFPRQWVHDEWLAAIAAASGRIDFLDQPLVDYRQHGANQIGVAKLSLSGKLRKLREPREARNKRLAENAEMLCERLTALAVTGTAEIAPAIMAAAQGKRAHENIRSSLPVSRFARLIPVLRERRNGGYSLYGRGLADVVRDVVQPAH
jgi:glycosyltransferase involved in cell wall biosynthesis